MTDRRRALRSADLTMPSVARSKRVHRGTGVGRRLWCLTGFLETTILTAPNEHSFKTIIYDPDGRRTIA
jgi:hypothetical protein